MSHKINELIDKRRSIRKYNSDKPATKEQLKKLLEAAMSAPSARNTRPWEFIAITDPAVLEEIHVIHSHAGMCVSAGAAIVVVAVPPKDDFPYEFYSQDCGAAAQNILLEAVHMGLGTCWCGVYPVKERVAGFRKLLNISEDKFPFCVIAVGTPAESPDKKGFYDESKVRFVE